MTSTTSTRAPLAEQVAELMALTDVARPTPTEVMGVLDVNFKIEQYLTAAAKAWLIGNADARFDGCHHIEFEAWDEHGAQMTYYPKWVSDSAYREYVTIPMSDLLPDFAEAYQLLCALGGG
jgi:hypothetical protein